MTLRAPEKATIVEVLSTFPNGDELIQAYATTPKAVGLYRPFTKEGTTEEGIICSTSGVAPKIGGDVLYLQPISSDDLIELGKRAAALCAANLLCIMKLATGGKMEDVNQLLHMEVAVSSPPDFTNHPKVADGASEVMSKVFGPERGVCTRFTRGASSLPHGCAVEIAARFRMDRPR